MGFVTSLVGVLAHFRTPSLVFGSTDFGNWFRQGAGAAEIPAVERKDYVRGTSFLIPKRITLDDSVARVPGTSLFSEEDLLQYCEGGYHPVSLGDMFGDRYEVVRKLGFGQNATVWLALDRRYLFYSLGGMDSLSNLSQTQPSCCPQNSESQILPRHEIYLQSEDPTVR